MSSMLCLGDSYTIGEAVSEKDSFPFQVVRLLNNKGLNFSTPLIVAQTGWTTLETLEAMKACSFQKCYDWVTVLSGVNNQYRGYSVLEYKKEFESLLSQSLELSGNRKERVIVLSIPDWGSTPFAKDRNCEEISQQIEKFNSVNKKLSETEGFRYIDIYPGSKEAKTNNELIATDGLHPSPVEYARWAQSIVEIILLESKRIS